MILDIFMLKNLIYKSIQIVFPLHNSLRSGLGSGIPA